MIIVLAIILALCAVSISNLFLGKTDDMIILFGAIVPLIAILGIIIYSIDKSNKKKEAQ